VTFFVDENVSPRLAEILDIFDQENQISHLSQVCERGAADIDWLDRIGKWSPKPAILGGDARIARNAVERAALKEAGLTFVVLAAGWMKTPFQEQAWKLLKAWPGVVQNVKTVVRPTLFELALNGKLRRKPWI